MSEQTVLSNLLVELRRGTQILAVLSQLKTQQYGYSLLQRLEEKGISIEAGTLYPLMRRLESQNLLSSTWDTTESRPRKYYVLSPLGIETLNQLINEWQSITHEIKILLED
jgi:DNA-binding PadR family transcriptional regulator